MTLEQAYVFGVLGATLCLFIWGRWRYDVVSVLALLAVAIPGIIDIDGVFAGFGHPAVITVAALLAISKTLQGSSLIGNVGSFLARTELGPSLQVMTPDGKGYLPMAAAEVYTALVAVKTALHTPEDLEKLSAGAKGGAARHRPIRIKEGPGRGFGVEKAAKGIISYVTAAGKSSDASQKVRSYARWVSTSAENFVVRADRITELLGKVMCMKTAKNAARVLRLVSRMCQEILLGKDTNKDGKVSWKKHEGGLAQAERYTTMMLRLEKLMK